MGRIGIGVGGGGGLGSGKKLWGECTHPAKEFNLGFLYCLYYSILIVHFNFFSSIVQIPALSSSAIYNVLMWDNQSINQHATMQESIQQANKGLGVASVTR